jgi:polyphosphate kinase
VAPSGVRPGIIRRIEREAQFALEGRDARVQMKVNHLVDEKVIDALYRASEAGVQCDLVVRTNCTLRPGVQGLSDNIRVRSIVGRFLEHSRVLQFENGGEAEIWLGSADMMHRNLDRRVEVLVAVTDLTARGQLQDMLDRAMSDDIVAWDLRADGHWEQRTSGDRPLVDYQLELMQAHSDRIQ